jgi:predicted transposase YbfD/YdcC
LRGSKDLKDAHLFARMNQKFFKKQCALDVSHGIPDPTTISRVLALCDPNELARAYQRFLVALGIPLGTTYSFDGKTIRALSRDETIRHMLSLFSHDQHMVLGQIGVSGKENEIPALPRLLEQAGATADAEPGTNLLAGTLLLGDALHTQKTTCTAILKAKADYLFVVKGNQKHLFHAILAEVTGTGEAANPTPLDTHEATVTNRGRQVTVTVQAMSAQATGDHDPLWALGDDEPWEGVVTMGILRRTGTRTSKDGTIQTVDETIGFISSRALTAEQVATALRAHWCVENNLHWVKDVVFQEDVHTLRKGNAPQVMSFLRGMVISVGNLVGVRSLSETIHNLEKSVPLLGRFVTMAALV